MRLGNFSLLIPEGCEYGEGYVRMEHNRQYRLQMGNHCHSQRCDAEVSIDGKPMGSYRINGGCTIILERSSFDNGRFTFLRADTEAAGQAGVHKIATPERGLVRVTFRPERKPVPVYRRGPGGSSVGGAYHDEVKTCGAGMLRSAHAEPNQLYSMGANSIRPQNMAAGITGLTGHSDQSFVEVSNLDYDPAGETTITLRLVADSFTPRELTVAPQSNPVPAPVS